MDMTFLDSEKQAFSLSMPLNLGLDGCSNPEVNSEASLAGESLSRTTPSEETGMSKPAEHNLTSSSTLAYFDFDSVALSAKALRF